MPLAALRHGGPEDFLDGVLVGSRWRPASSRHRASQAAVASAAACFDCSAMPRARARAPPWATVPPGGAGAVEGKYLLRCARRYHWRFLQCAGAAPGAAPRMLEAVGVRPRRRAAAHRVLVSVLAGRRTSPLTRSRRSSASTAPATRPRPGRRPPARWRRRRRAAAERAASRALRADAVPQPERLRARGRGARRAPSGGGVLPEKRVAAAAARTVRLVLGDSPRLLLVLALPQPGARDDAPPPRHPRRARADRPPRPR